jgi:hypothetical protein
MPIRCEIRDSIAAQGIKVGKKAGRIAAAMQQQSRARRTRAYAFSTSTVFLVNPQCTRHPLEGVQGDENPLGLPPGRDGRVANHKNPRSLIRTHNPYAALRRIDSAGSMLA